MADTTIARAESPFLDLGSFEAVPDAVFRPRGLSSPFVEAFAPGEDGGEGAASDGVRRVLVAELYDDELDAAIYEAVGESAAFVGSAPGRLGLPALKLRCAPLAEALEDGLDRAADEFGRREITSVSDSEVDDVFGRMSPGRPLAPEFEQLFGGLKSAFSRIAKGAVSLAKKGIQVATQLGLGPLLAKLKALVRPLLERVLKAAIDRLPAAVQPAARALAGKLPSLFGRELEAGEDRAFDAGAIQAEFNERVADALLGEDASRVDEETSSWYRPDDAGEATLADLDAARERFTSELESLQAGEDPGPAVERFVPALLPVLKLGLRLAGRKRVVSLLSGLVSRLIARFVGPAQSGALSTALVDAGLKLIGLEVSPDDQRRTAHAAVAAAVEETVRRVAALPDAVLDNETLAEGAIVRAFEEAAAANLPPVLPDAVYRQRPELAETDSRRGTWIPLPLRGPRRFKKFSRVFRTRITPRVAMAVTSFGGVPLAHYLQEQLGLDPGESLEADVHMYELLPGTVLGDVARMDASGAGAPAIADFHPLTGEAAALLAHEPGLGRDATGANAPADLAVGQRVYRVAVPGRRVATVGGRAGRGRSRRHTSVHAVLDFPGDRIRIFVFLAERKAQELAVALRKQGHAGAIAAALQSVIDRGLAGAATGNVTGRVRLLHEALTLDEARGKALARLPRAVVAAFLGRVAGWTTAAIGDFLGTQAARFVAAAEDTKDGVTIVLTLANPPGMAGMRTAVGGGSPNGSAPTGAPASVQVDVVPGFVNA